MARRVKRLALVLILLFIVVFAGNWWLSRQRTLASGLAASAQMAVIEGASATLVQGPTPSDWPIRGFIPTSLLKTAVSDVLRGTQVVIPIGRPINGHVDGYLRLTIKSSTLVPEDMKLGVRLDCSATYQPDRKLPAWARPRVSLAIDAILFPIAQFEKDGVLLTQFRVVPNSISLLPGWLANDHTADGLLSALLANEAGVRLGDSLVFSVPAVSPLLVVDPSLNSSSFQEFPDGGTNIVLSMTRPPQHFHISFDRWLATRSGIWLLGGKSLPASIPATLSNPPSSEELENRRAALIEKLSPFQKTDEQVELTVPTVALTGFIDSLLSPTPLTLAMKTSGTTGLIKKETVHAQGLGDMGLEVRPYGDNFGTGTISVNPQPATWSGQKGFLVSATANATASVSLDLHLDSGLGGGLGNRVELSAQGGATVPLYANFEKRSTPVGTATVLQPFVPCTPVVIAAQPGTTPIPFSDWAVASPVGLQFEGNFGGTKISPLAIMDGLPIVIPAPTPKDANGNSIEQDPERVIVMFKHPFIGLTLSPSDVKETDATVVMSAVATIAPRDSKETDAEVAGRSALHDALTASAPSEACTTLAALKVVGGGITVTDLYKEEQFLLQNFKDHQAIAQEVWDTVKKLDPKTMPADLAKAVELSLQAGAEPIQHTLQNVLDTASTVKNVPAQIASKPSSALTNPIINPDPVSRTVIQGIQNLFPSDARFKLDLVQVGMLANGVPLYRFRYRWSDQLYVGVLAQDVEKLLPNAVSKDSRGFLWVDYDQLGIKFFTWEDWSRSHPASKLLRRTENPGP